MKLVEGRAQNLSGLGRGVGEERGRGEEKKTTTFWKGNATYSVQKVKSGCLGKRWMNRKEEA